MKRLAFILWRTSKRDLRLAWFALRHPARPVWLIPALALLAIYSVSPLSYAIPPLGVVDDLVVVPMALHLLLKLLPPQVRAGALREDSPIRVERP